jgi:lysophospholipase L1-like esterase
MERWLRRPEDLVPLHRRYAEIVREVARAENAPLCDVAEEIRALPRPDVAPAWFMADGIHLTPAGADVFGELLYRDFVKQGLVEALTR